MHKIFAVLLVTLTCWMLLVGRGNCEDTTSLSVINDVVACHVGEFSYEDTPWVVLKGTLKERVFAYPVPIIGQGPKKEGLKVKKIEYEHDVVLLRRLGGAQYRLEIFGSGGLHSYDKAGRAQDGLTWYASKNGITTELSEYMSVLTELLCDVTDALGLLPLLLEGKSNVLVVGPRLLDLGEGKKVSVFEIKRAGSRVTIHADAKTKQLVSLSLAYPSEEVPQNVIFSDFRFSDVPLEDLLFPRVWKLRGRERISLQEVRVEKLFFTNTMDSSWFEKTTADRKPVKLLSYLEEKFSERNEELLARKLSEFSEEQKLKLRELIGPVVKEYYEELKEIEKKYPEYCPEQAAAIKELDEKYEKIYEDLDEEIDKILDRK